MGFFNIREYLLGKGRKEEMGYKALKEGDDGMKAVEKTELSSIGIHEIPHRYFLIEGVSKFFPNRILELENNCELNLHLLGMRGGTLLKEFVPENKIRVVKLPEELWLDKNWQRWGGVVEVVME
jgi:hypothetical protein